MHFYRLQRTIVAAGLLVLLAACTQQPVSAPNDTQAVPVASGATLALLPAAAVLRNVVLTQRVDAVYVPVSPSQGVAPQSHSFIVQIEATNDELRMVGLTPMGVQIFALQQKGTALDVDVPAYVSLPFDPRFMLADMQLALAPVAVLNARLSGATVQQAAGSSQRFLRAADGGERMQISYRGEFCTQGGELNIEHLERHYRIQITTLSCDAAP